MNDYIAEIHSVVIQTDENGVLVIGLEDDYSGIIFSFLDLEEQDIELGMTRYYLGNGEGSAGSYNCIDKITLKEDVIVYLNKAGREMFSCDRLILKLNNDNFKILSEALRKEFESESVEIE